MSFAGPVNLLTSRGRVDCNIFSIKNLGVSLAKQENILQKLVFMGTFEEISEWVTTHSKGLKFIANPSNASDTDRFDCLFAVQEPLALALKDVEKRRKNGRDGRLLEAAKAGDYIALANILASAAASYWKDHGFLNSSKELKIASFLKNDEKNLEKKDFQKAQIERVGAAIDLERARKKDAFQLGFDFFETEEILKNEDF